MPRLLLLRHAKSSWDDPNLDDHDRPLSRRGRRATRALRDHLATMDVVPNVVLCSTATRAVQTLDAVAKAFPDGSGIEFRSDLYGAPAEYILGVLHALPDTVDCALVVAHNPGTEDLATSLAGSGDRSLIDRMRDKYPTGALATLEFGGTWSNLGAGSAELTGFVVPRELAETDRDGDN